MNHLALVSIAIPAFNPDFLHAALMSALSQDYPNLEVLVCDDSRGDEICRIVDDVIKQTDKPVRYLRNPQTLGFGRNLLMCVEQARGQLIKFLCDDDLLFSTCVSEQAAVLNQHADVSMSVCQRMLCAADDSLLPSRMLNMLMCPQDAVVKGADLLEALESMGSNLFGGLSHALMRRELVQEFLPALVEGGFVARLDMALYLCMMRRGNLGHLERFLSLERLHPGRLSHQAGMTLVYPTETLWIKAMLEARSSEAAPAKGWVRYIPLACYDGAQDAHWEEYDLNGLRALQEARVHQQLGSDCLSFEEIYSQWLDCRRLSEAQLKLLPKRFERWPSRPRIVPVIWAGEGDEQALRTTLASLAEQSYAPAACWVCAPVEMHLPETPGIERLPAQGNGLAQLQARLAQGDADWVFLLQAGDRLVPHALAIMGERMALRDRVCMYVDEGSHDNLRASTPIFKPDFNLDLMRSLPYVGRLLAFECKALLQVGGFDLDFDILAPHDLFWRLAETRGLQVIEHVDELLVHCQWDFAQWLSDPRCVAQAPRVVQAHLRRLGVDADVVGASDQALCRVAYRHETQAGVSILVSVGDDLVAARRCVESLFEHCTYANFEVLLIAVTDTPADLRQWLQAMQSLGSDQLRVVEVSAGNRVARLNEASLTARGEYLLMLDTACMAFEPRWLVELMAQAQRPEVGVVGPKLCTPSGTVFGAGLVLGLHGEAGSPFVGLPVDANGYMHRLGCTQNWSALSLDCLLVRREVFHALGGFDVEGLQGGLQDADFCLRVAEQGYLVVMTPMSMVARLTSQQGEVQGGPQGNADSEVFHDRWLARLARDPAYNRNLSLTMTSFSLEPGLRQGWDPFLERVLPSVLALPVNSSAVGHYRVSQPFRELESAGWIQGRQNYRVPGLIELEREKPDVIVFQYRSRMSSVEEIGRVVRASSARHIYEIDDYIIGVPERNDHSRNMPADIREAVSLGVSMCDRVVVSTQPLADALSSMHQDIRVVPNMLAAKLWVGLASERQTTARPRVGWAGGTSHRGDLELLQEVIKTLAGQVDWVFFGMCPDPLRPYVKEFHSGIPMSEYPRKLASLNLDLALAPLEQNLFNDCKSNLRLLEYGACGFPVICSDTKAYDGYLPCTRVVSNSTAEWLDAIRMHLADPDASYRQGEALREVVLRDYVLNERHLQHWANAWLAD
ncbi:glycosyl transferase family 2 [Pseudomonas sp. 250J]|uniref:glycosyltransferase n=1 Tax=unclassified Pseudomonas TaxID=196821 RepID=UPI0006830EBD|nr:MULTISPECIES: glycosyltransferase [unclassified Pseudomonas]KNX76800.1 glycosyl transferase family 2 [Pseudomonas sp. 250J]QZA55883.1 glycosyltransferase [Pseudomonas sp. 2hn]